jgi:ribose/xylose/arabinose/galactoside ABC-type transport system permease subunit
MERMNNTVQKILKQTPVIVWVCIALFIFFAIFAKGFTSPMNLSLIMKNASILIIVSMGMTMAVLSAGLDLSVGYTMSLAGLLSVLTLQKLGDNSISDVFVSVAVAMLVGAAVGLFNGIMIGKLKFNFFLVTFASMSMAAGLAQVISGGSIFGGLSRTYRFIGGGSIGPIYTVVIIAAIVALIMAFVLSRTRFGLHIYAIGDSEICARQSGVNVTGTIIGLYVISGLLAGFSGALLASQTNSISPVSGKGYEFNAIAAVVVGGTPLVGGIGGVLGSVFGALLIAILKDGLVLIGLSAFWQQTLIGCFTLLVIVIDVLTTRHRRLHQIRRVYRYDAKC